MRDIDNDNDIRASLKRLTDPQGNTPDSDALWGDLVDRRRKRRNRNRALAALPLLLVAVLAVGILSTRGSDDSRSDVAAGDGDQPEASDDFAPFEMTYRTQSYQGGETVPSTWKLTYESWTNWETTLIDGGPGVAEEPGFRRALSDGTLTEYNPDGTVRLEEPVDGRMTPLALMNKGPRTGEAEGGNSDSTYRHEFTSTQEHECPDDPADSGPYCEQSGGTVVVETVEAFNEDGVPVFAEERISGTDRVVWQFETLTYERLGSSEDCASADDSRPSARCGGVYGPVMFGPEQHGVMEQARLAGRVLLEGDCLYLMQESDAARYAPLPIVWPYGTLWEDDPAGVRLADDTFVPVGSEITAAGGGHDVDRLTDLGHAESVAGRARQCAGEDVQTVAYVQGEIEVLPDEQAPLDSSQGKGFVLKFLGHLRDGDFEAAATLWSGYPVSEPNRPTSERVQYVEQLAEYPPFARIVASDTMTMFVTPSMDGDEGHVITIMDPRSGDSPPVAAAFLTGLSGDGDDQRWWIHRLPAIDAAADAELSDGGYVEPGEQVVVPGLPVEGGVRGFVNSTEVPVEVDLENETFTFVVPESASGDIALTFVVATPEEPIVRAFAATVR